MSSLISTKCRVDLALSLLNSVSSGEYYFGFGRTTPWTLEGSPPNILDNTTEEITTRQNLVGIKKITTNNVSLVVPRVNWTSGVVYTKFSATDAELSTKNFYVITDDYNVYKCIDNNSGASSTTKPTGTVTTDITLADGYVWKFMYNLSVNMVTNFLTVNWCPVPTGLQKTAQQISVENSATYAVGEPTEKGHGYSAADELFATNVIFSVKLEDDEDGIFPTNISYRQAVLLKSPKLNNDSLAVNSTYRMNTSSSTINNLSGKLLYIDNFIAVTRGSTQSESFQIILGL